MYSIVIPVYKNEASIPELIDVLKNLNERLDRKLEVVFVIDGSPDASFLKLESMLQEKPFNAKIIVLSRNFGAFSAVKAGLAEASGPYFAVMAADLQEPPELIYDFFQTLEHEPYDVVIGTRKKRNDPPLSKLFSNLFWFFYRNVIQKEVPHGGVDIFGCNTIFRDNLVNLPENNSSLIGLLFWLGFRRKEINYERKPRIHGKSSWSFRKRLRYLSNSIFAFSDLPIRILISIGLIGMSFSFIFGLIVFVANLFNYVSISGFTTNALLLMFILGFNSFGLGVIGSYVWRAYENSKQRPQSVVMIRKHFTKEIQNG
jgi:glycosyltransferase involved in cell wall biosynthesis